MDFFSGVFRFQPVISLMSCSTSSAVARNSGLLAVPPRAGGRDAACWGHAGAIASNKTASARPTRLHSRKETVIEGIQVQNNRLLRAGHIALLAGVEDSSQSRLIAAASAPTGCRPLPSGCTGNSI